MVFDVCAFPFHSCPLVTDIYVLVSGVCETALIGQGITSPRTERDGYRPIRA